MFSSLCSQLQPSSSFQQLHYLSTAGSSQIVVSPYPFTLKVKTARIRICQGCRIPFQSDCQAPLDIVVSRLECRPYKHDGVTKTPTAPSNSHYHVNMQCILSADPTFVSHKLVIPEAVRVYLDHSHSQAIFTFSVGHCYPVSRLSMCSNFHLLIIYHCINH